MSNFVNRGIFKLVFAASVTSLTAPSVALATLHVPPKEYFNANEWVSLARISKLANDIKKSAKKHDSKKAWSQMMDLKNEVEVFKNQRINMPGCFDAVVKDIHKEGYKLNDKQIKTLWDMVNGKSKKSIQYENYLYHCYDLEESPSKFGFDIYRNGEVHDTDIPISVQVGVTAALAGYFLTFIPHPATQTFGWGLVTFGSGMAANGMVGRLDHDQNIDRDKERGK